MSRSPLDRPITDSAQDVLDRAGPAQHFADQVLALDVSEGLVVGVLGEWGSGKTSYVNLARARFLQAGCKIIDFNPWMFSGVGGLTEAFFAEVSSELKLLPDIGDAGKAFAEYGELLSGFGWVPFLGPWAERAKLAFKLVAGGLKGASKLQGGTSERRKRVEVALRKAVHPVIVIVDDIDRLTTDEIRKVFQLVRLTASFPNIIYVVAFDRLRVERALTEDGVPGRAYLEKILQLAVDLPTLPHQLITTQVLESLDAALDGLENVTPLDQEAWPNHFHDIIRPLISNLRDISRYTLATRITVSAIGAEVALADVLALEAIRLFLPDVFARLPDSIDILTSLSNSPFGGNADPRHKEGVELLIQSAGSRQELVRTTLKLLFPASRRSIDNYHFGYDSQKRWLRDKRVAHEDIFRVYLERSVGNDLRVHKASEQLWALLTDSVAVETFLGNLDPSILEDVISGLEIFETDFGPTQAVSGVVALLNALPLIPERPRGMLGMSSRMKVTRVTLRLLRALGTPEAVAAGVSTALPQIRTLSGRWEVISDVGHNERAGHKLVDLEVAKRLEREWRYQVRHAPSSLLQDDPDLLRVFLEAGRGLEEGEMVPPIPASPGITLRLIESSRSEALSQQEGSRSVRRQGRLAWDALEQVYGSEQVLNERVDELLGSSITIDPALRELVLKYRSGWRPEREW